MREDLKGMTTEYTGSFYNWRLIGLMKQVNEGVTIGSKQTVGILTTRHRHFVYIFTQLDSRTLVHLCQLMATTASVVLRFYF